MLPDIDLDYILLIKDQLRIGLNMMQGLTYYSDSYHSDPISPSYLDSEAKTGFQWIFMTPEAESAYKESICKADTLFVHIKPILVSTPPMELDDYGEDKLEWIANFLEKSPDGDVVANWHKIQLRYAARLLNPIEFHRIIIPWDLCFTSLHIEAQSSHQFSHVIPIGPRC